MYSKYICGGIFVASFVLLELDLLFVRRNLTMSVLWVLQVWLDEATRTVFLVEKCLLFKRHICRPFRPSESYFLLLPWKLVAGDLAHVTLTQLIKLTQVFSKRPSLCGQWRVTWCSWAGLGGIIPVWSPLGPWALLWAPGAARAQSTDTTGQAPLWSVWTADPRWYCLFCPRSGSKGGLVRGGDALDARKSASLLKQLYTLTWIFLSLTGQFHQN